MFCFVLHAASLMQLILFGPVFAVSIDNQEFSRGPIREKRTQGGIHVPLFRQEHRDLSRRASVQQHAAGLGDYLDVTYNVLLKIGQTVTSVVLDTGSSDLWVVSTACQGNYPADVPLYSPSSFQPVSLDVRIQYGDSLTGTYASGPVGSDTVALAGLELPGQYFAAVNDTNTTVLQTGSAGLFGIGFPLNSVIWDDLYVQQHNPPHSSVKREIPTSSSHRDPFNLMVHFFPKTHLNAPTPSSVATSTNGNDSQLLTRQLPPPSTTANIFSSYATIGPFIPRLVEQGIIAQPMFTIALQRDTVELGGNQGVLSIGELPEGVMNESLIWVPIRGYTPAQGGLIPPPDAPNEVYPIDWEIPIDDVFFDGVKLPRSQLSSQEISLTAIVDTGSSLIRGPADVISFILTAYLNGGHFPCSATHILEFQIGGQMFPVDPLDFVSQTYAGNLEECAANIAPTDVPVVGSGYLHSWSLGDPFLKGVLTSFYFGNLSRPGQDPPRVGLLSTISSLQDAAAQLLDSVSNADGNWPATSETAPSGTPPVYSTGVGGVPLAWTLPTGGPAGQIGRLTGSTQVSSAGRISFGPGGSSNAILTGSTVGEVQTDQPGHGNTNNVKQFIKRGTGSGTDVLKWMIGIVIGGWLFAMIVW